MIKVNGFFPELHEARVCSWMAWNSTEYSDSSYSIGSEGFSSRLSLSVISGTLSVQCSGLYSCYHHAQVISYSTVPTGFHLGFFLEGEAWKL